eukprot:scaffold34134_cov56-Attheya_sp.AAC.3
MATTLPVFLARTYGVIIVEQYLLVLERESCRARRKRSEARRVDFRTCDLYDCDDFLLPVGPSS